MSYDAEKFLRSNPAFSGVMVGEGEETFQELAGHYIEGKPENMSYKLTPADYISLEIQPKSEEEADITAADIQVSMNLSASQYQIPGNYQVPLTVVLPDGYTLTSQATIAVNLVKLVPQTEEESQTVQE